MTNSENDTNTNASASTPVMSTTTSTSVRIEPFSRQCDFLIWYKKFELQVKLAKVPEVDKIIHLITNLDISIFESVITAFPDTSFEYYDEIVEFLTDRHSIQDKFLNRLEFMNIAFTGTFDEFASNLQTLFENFDKSQLREQILMAKFLSAIPKSLSTELRVRRPTDLSECVRICNSLQSSSTSLQTAALSHMSKTKPPSTGRPTRPFTKSNRLDTRKCI